MKEGEIPPLFSGGGVVLNLPAIRLITPFPSSIGIYGSSGSGKSYALKYIAELLYLDHNCKIIDIYDEGRLENCFYLFPNDDQRFKELRGFRARGFPFECFVPATPEMPRRLPDCFRPFRICFRDLEVDEFLILLGRLSNIQEDVIRFAWDNVPKNISFLEFIGVVKRFISTDKIRIDDRVLDVCDEKTALSLVQKLDKLYRMGILSDREDPLNLDIDKIMRDKKTISAFSFTFVKDQNMRHLLWGYLFRVIYTTRINERFYRYPELALIHREIQNNAPARGKKSSLSYQGQGISLDMLRKIVAEPRDVGIRLVADSQDPLKIDSDVRKGFKTRVIFHTDKAQLDTLCGQFWLPEVVKIGIQKSDIGVCALKVMPQPSHPKNKYGVQYPVKFPPPRSKPKGPNDLFFVLCREHKVKSKSWVIEDPKPIVRIKTITPEPEVVPEKTNLKTESIYNHYFSIIRKVVADKPGVNIRGVVNSALVQELGLGWTYGKVQKIVEWAASRRPPLIVVSRSGRNAVLNLPDSPDSGPSLDPGPGS